MSKTQLFVLLDSERKANCMEFIHRLPADGSLEVVIRSQRASKTKEQLGALFGLWIKEISDRTGYDKDYIHAEMKRIHLVPIYRDNPESPEQEMWVDSVLRQWEKGDIDAMNKRKANISLEWANIKQVSQYMNDIQAYWIEKGFPLSVPDKYRKHFKNEDKQAA